MPTPHYVMEGSRKASADGIQPFVGDGACNRSFSARSRWALPVCVTAHRLTRRGFQPGQHAASRARRIPPVDPPPHNCKHRNDGYQLPGGPRSRGT
jgi:hypothetical protein